MWTVYDHPSDFPDCFVARKWIASSGMSEPIRTDSVLTADNLKMLKVKIQHEMPYVIDFIPRQPDDDPVIVGCYL